MIRIAAGSVDGCGEAVESVIRARLATVASATVLACPVGYPWGVDGQSPDACQMLRLRDANESLVLVYLASL